MELLIDSFIKNAILFKNFHRISINNIMITSDNYDTCIVIKFRIKLNSLDNLSKITHTVPINKISYVTYQLKPYLSKKTLINNTIALYLKTLEEQKETYLQIKNSNQY